MTSFSEICETAERHYRIHKWPSPYTGKVECDDALDDVLACSRGLIDYICMIRDNVFPNILLAYPDNKVVQAIVRDALKQLEDM